MSIRLLDDTLRDLPNALHEQVLNYARSVEIALPDIFREAGVKQRTDLSDQLVFIAGIRKLFAIIDSAYWVLDNASAMMEEQHVGAIRAGGTLLSRGSEYHRSVDELRRRFEVLLNDLDIADLVAASSYVEVLLVLSNGH